MCIGTRGTTSVKSLQGSKAMLGAGPLETGTTLASLCLNELQLAVERVNLGGDVEDTRVGLVVTCDLSRQTPIVSAAGQVHGLVIGGRLAADGVNEPHREWLGGGVANVRGGGVQVVLEDGIALLTEGAEREGDGAVAQFDVARLAHDIVGVGDDEIRESTVVFLEALGAFGVWLAGHLCTEIGKLFAELFDLRLGLEVLEGAADGRVGKADGDSTKGAGVEFRVSLHDIERALGRQGVVVSVDTVNDFAFLGLGVWGDGEAWTCGSGGSFGGRCARGSSDDGLGMCREGGWFHKCDGGGTELCLGRDDFDGAAENVDGLVGGGHVSVMWGCCRR